ncbi:protein kinase domain-containing protein [Ideonella sp. A 288]|uniref:protein kinase domain-containing protein n=1 Tax=Ideonella sp. A 288 TaxID=1962181 RepID=UPI001F2D0058|nr:protein kinase [Ideonella sp. A 288]
MTDKDRPSSFTGRPAPAPKPAASPVDDDVTQIMTGNPASSAPAPNDEATMIMPRALEDAGPPSEFPASEFPATRPGETDPTPTPTVTSIAPRTPAASGFGDGAFPRTLSGTPTQPPTQPPTHPQGQSTGTLPGTPAQPPATLPGKSVGAEPDIRRVGRYQILERLGRGGMATVFKAHDPGIGRDVAIKFLHASLCEDEGCRVRFLREAGAAGRLSHANIAIVHDVGEIDGRPYMAMELLTGESLAEELEEKKTLPVREVVTIGIQLARALDYAHGKGIVHRDIKPANIMRMADSRTIKVTDFGIAHIDDPTDDQTDRTRVGDILGTPQYMSPEQARGDKIDGRSDLFSVGIVLYQMITGVRPFRGDSLIAVATKIANEDPPPIDKQRTDVPAALRRAVDRCLAKQQANRFQTGAELAEALVKVLNEIDEAATAKNRPRIVPLRVKWAVTMALIVAVVMGITATVITQRQQAAMMAQVSDYGASLARFIAAQNSAAVLGEDWDSVEVAVQEIMKTRNFERVVVIDLGGIVRVSSVPGQAGASYKPAAAETLAKLGGNTAATRYEAGGESVLGFESPITFQDKQVGRVALGIPEKPLTQVARLSITLMIILAVVTVLAVAIAMYFVADWFAKPVRLLSESMAEIAKGRFDHRIAEKRKDEFGQLYEVFDAMAAALQARERASAGDAASRPSTVGHTLNIPVSQATGNTLPGATATMPPVGGTPPSSGSTPPAA